MTWHRSTGWMVVGLVAFAFGAASAGPMLYDFYLEQPGPYRQPDEIDDLLWMTSAYWSPFLLPLTGAILPFGVEVSWLDFSEYIGRPGAVPFQRP